jgi:hypothetical protein
MRYLRNSNVNNLVTLSLKTLCETVPWYYLTKSAPDGLEKTGYCSTDKEALMQHLTRTITQSSVRLGRIAPVFIPIYAGDEDPDPHGSVFIRIRTDPYSSESAWIRIHPDPHGSVFIRIRMDPYSSGSVFIRIHVVKFHCNFENRQYTYNFIKVLP